MIDNGCECLTAISNFVVRKASLPRIEITPRRLAEATYGDGKNVEYITEMTKIELNIDLKKLYMLILYLDYLMD